MLEGINFVTIRFVQLALQNWMGTRSFDSHGQCECMNVWVYEWALTQYDCTWQSYTHTVCVSQKICSQMQSVARKSSTNTTGHWRQLWWESVPLHWLPCHPWLHENIWCGQQCTRWWCDWHWGLWWVHLFTPYILSFFFFYPLFFRHLTVGSISCRTVSPMVGAQQKQQRFKISINVCPDNVFWTV